MKDRQSLEQLVMHRRRLVADLKAATGFECGSSIAQIDEDIALIEAGLRTLSGPIGG
ncbi:hypothetical protein [Bradyrhizobium sp. 143]|uniref:hypothetical protein n=1 Tax=unclassified Bradyrhizobium TaxID=2631580 RepID=UPI00320A836A